MTMQDNAADDAQGPWIVVTGDLAIGFEYFGPFETWQAATDWADGMTDIAGFFLLQNPDSELDK